ncbi:AzlC family ABC transporter permease [Clostridium sp. AF02-29]|uniref:AzlC family ABC transporter permease n=1 Tax=Clostridium sp. AF02-29 TaxID=2292993 RepID=UPI00308115AE
MKKTERKKESAQTMEEQAAVGKINGSGVRMALLYAFPKTVPIMVGYVFLGMAYGILMSVNGFGVFWAALNSLLVYTGSLEFIGVNFLAAAVSPVTAFVMALMISARHIFYGLSMLGKYQNVSKKLKPYLIFALTDETFSIVCEEEPPETISREWMYFWMSLLDQMYWIAGSVMGEALGNVITFNTKGLDFALTALFVMIFTEQWIGQKRHWPAVTGVVCSVICLKLFGQSAFIIPTMIVILAVSAIVYKKENQKENDKEKDEKEDREKQMERREEMSHAE